MSYYGNRSMGAEAELIAAEEPLAGWGYRLKPSYQQQPDEAVYIVEAVGGDMVKIGMVRRLRGLSNRMAELQAGCPYPLRLVLVVPGLGQSDEKALHKLFDAHRIRGEWFKIEGVVAGVVDLARTNPRDAAMRLALATCG